MLRFKICGPAVFLGMAALLGAAGCSRTSTANPIPAPAPPAATAPAQATVTAIRPEKKTVRRAIGQPGQIEANQQTPIHAKVAGFVDAVLRDLGDEVEMGQTLAVVSVPELDEELAQKEAQVAQARAELERAQKDVNTAEAKVALSDALLERWKSASERLQKLIKSKEAVEQKTVDETRYQLDTARAGREESVANRERAQAEVRVAQAKLQVAQAERRRLEALVDYAIIKAPFAGVISRRNVDKGHFVQPASGTRGEPLFIVLETDPVRIFVDVPEADAVWVTKGTPARVRVQAWPGREFEAKVERTSWALDPRARTLRVQLEVANPKGDLRSGMYAYATILVEHAQTWTVPASSVVNQGDQAFVYRVENGKAVRTPVEIGLRQGALVEVVRKQVKLPHEADKSSWEEFSGREEIVSSHATTLTDGQTVSVNPGGK
jgi:HlyD family secretion protein